MRLVNHTRLDDEDVRAVMSWLLQGLGHKVRLVVVNYTHGKTYNGRAFLNERKVTLSFPKAESRAYPIRFNYWLYCEVNKFPRYEAKDEFEACVVILAHEAYHFRQEKNGWRLRQKTCEVWAAQKLREFRAFMEPLPTTNSFIAMPTNTIPCERGIFDLQTERRDPRNTGLVPQACSER